MASGKRGAIEWWTATLRAIIPLDERFHVPHGLRRRLKRNPFTVTFDRDFAGVIHACATTRTTGNWISREIIESYCALHRLGHAHSVETRLNGQLVGGLYGVHLGGAFFGESMFHTATDASKVALVTLVERLRAGKFTLLDTQWLTPHLARFGAYEIPQDEYLVHLAAALRLRRSF